jgi:hypothetical protein
VDFVLRQRHDDLVREFPCISTQLRIVKTSPGSRYPRTIEAFCTNTRAKNFGQLLETFDKSCSTCPYFQAVDEATLPFAASE